MKIKNKIIFISGTPISKIQGEKLDLNRFISKNFEVEYWDLTNMYYSKKALDLYFGGHPDFRYKFPIEKKFYDSNSVKKELKKLQDNVIFCYQDFLMQSNFWLLRGFKKNNISYYLGPRQTPAEAYQSRRQASNHLLKRLFNAILDGSIIKKLIPSVESKISNIFLHQLKLLIYRNTNYYKKPDFVIGSGSVGRKIWPRITAINNFISLQSDDVCWHKMPNLINYRYCVYVDEAIVYSPDRGLYEPDKKNSASNDFESFTKNMCHVFDIVEEKLNLKVIIASSGKYKYQNEALYGGRKMIYNKTNQLIQHSALALGHTSSGLYQAIINRKPIILLSDPSFSDYKKLNINSISIFLKAKQFNTIDITDKDISDELEHTNLQHYKELEYQYFKEKNSIESYHEVIEDYFNKYY